MCSYRNPNKDVHKVDNNYEYDGYDDNALLLLSIQVTNQPFHIYTYIGTHKHNIPSVNNLKKETETNI